MIILLSVMPLWALAQECKLAAGYAFGFIEGSLLTLTGFLIGSWIVFELVRKYGVKLVEVFFPKEKIQEVSFLKDPRRTKALALVLMTIPGTPKDFLSYFAGLTNLKLGQWLLIVGISRIPSLVTSTATGAAAGQKHYLLSGAMSRQPPIFVLTGLPSSPIIGCHVSSLSFEPSASGSARPL